jgi:hypothetical protein
MPRYYYNLKVLILLHYYFFKIVIILNSVSNMGIQGLLKELKDIVK